MKIDKNSKQLTMKLPKYDVSSQVGYIKSLADSIEFPVEELTSFILADFIFQVEKKLVLEKKDLADVMFTYFSHQEIQSKEFDVLKKKIKGELDEKNS